MWVPGYVDCATMADAEKCPDPLPEGFDAWLVYAGGSSAAHAWEPPELVRVAHMPRLPCWVPTPGTDNPETAAEDFLAWLRGHGVPTHNPGSGLPVHLMWDMETGQEPDPHWLDRACEITARVGYRNLPYGDLTTLFGEPARDGYMVANPTSEPHMYDRPEVKGTQWKFGSEPPVRGYDEWLIVRQLLYGLWLPTG